MKKRLLSMLLVVCMMITMIPAISLAETEGADYIDTKGHWAEGSIKRWSKYGVVEGSGGAFQPDSNLTRAQIAAILARLLDLPIDVEDAGFSDVDPDGWYLPYINACAKAGIMLGFNGKARPDDAVSRQEAMVLICRSLGIMPSDEIDFSDYQDGENIADWAAPYVAAMIEKGIVKGVSDSRVGGEDDINRASITAILDRAVVTVVTEPGTVINGEGAGIIIVKAENVTITGNVQGVVITPEASGKVKLDNATVEEAVVVMAEDITVSVGENSSVGTVAVTENAEGAKVEVSETGKVDVVQTDAPSSEVKVDGTVTIVSTSETAKDTKIETGNNSNINKVDNKAENTTITGSGKVDNVATSGNNTIVETGGTKVDVAEGTTGTVAGGKDVAGGESSTTEVKPSISGGSSGSSSGPQIVYVATIGDTNYETLEAAFEQATENSEIKVLNDVNLQSSAIEVSKTVTLNLNGKKITVLNDTVGYGVFHVVSGGSLTINDNADNSGVINGKGKNDYNMAIWADGGKVVINGGTYKNEGATDSKGEPHFDLIYAKNGGEITINGGIFKCETPKWTLNSHDTLKGTIVVKGGSFYQYDPSASDTENPIANFVATGYSSVKNGDYYEVAKNITTEAELRTAIAESGSYKLSADITLVGTNNIATLTIQDNDVKINLDGYKISAPNDTAGDGVFHVVSGGSLTINDKSDNSGIIDGKCNSRYNMAIWADGGEVVINGGTYTNEGATDPQDPTHIDLIYAKNDGKITINGGIFKCETPTWTLNIHGTFTGAIEVKGGSFYQYDPSASNTENPIANFLASGYKSSTEDGSDYYVVTVA